MVVTIAQGLRQSCLICMMSSDPYNKDCDKYYYYSHLSGEETEIQRDVVISCCECHTDYCKSSQVLTLALSLVEKYVLERCLLPKIFMIW